MAPIVRIYIYVLCTLYSRKEKQRVCAGVYVGIYIIVCVGVCVCVYECVGTCVCKIKCCTVVSRMNHFAQGLCVK